MIVVTAPTSNIGRRLVGRLLDHGEKLRVIARDPAKLPTEVSDRVEVIEGSHGDGEVLDRALAGAASVFWLVPADPGSSSIDEAFVGFTRPGAEAISRHGVARVVVITALGRDTPFAERAGHVTASLAADDLLATTGAHVMEVTAPSFMENIARQAAAIRDKGMFFGAIDADLRMPTCATDDIAAALLMDLRWTGRGHRAVLGPEDLSCNDMAATLSDVLGKPIRYQQLPFDAFKAGFVGMGMSDAMAQAMTDMMRAKNDGLDNAEVRTAANTTPTTFRRWCEEELAPILLA